MDQLRKFRNVLAFLAILWVPLASLFAQQTPAAKDTSSHTVRMVEVEPGVKLEVLDWGGTGRPLVFLAGLGFTAHEFDDFAPRFTAENHVYGITRRGFGASSAPAPSVANYSADRLGDDVLAVIDALGLKSPVLVGHSIAGEELSSVGTRHPEKVAGLVYLEAAYSYAYYDPKQGDLILDSIDLKKKLDAFLAAKVPDMKQFIDELQPELTRYSKDVEAQRQKLALYPPQKPQNGDRPPILVAIAAGRQKYPGVTVPVLAIFANPHGELLRMYQEEPKKREAVVENDRATNAAQIEAFKAAIRRGHVAVIPNASHFIYKSSPEIVEREMKTFLGTLH